MSLTVREILGIAENRMADGGIDQSKTDAELLLCHMMHCERKDLFMRWGMFLDEKEAVEFFELVDVRMNGTPLQYITGKQYFMELCLDVDESVLIPRQDTEILVNEVNKYIEENRLTKARVLDLCTGSGVIAISLAKKQPTIKITASDVSADALKIAEKNASRLGVSKNIKFVKSDVFEGLKRKKYDIIVTNPPYIPSGVLPSLQREIYEHEPLLALDGGEDGLDVYRRIVGSASNHLRKKGALFMEIGHDQADDVRALMDSESVVVKDLSGMDRVIRSKP